MARRKKVAFPESALVYVVDYCDDVPLFGVVDSTEEIPDGEPVGIYTRKEVRIKRVTHDLE